MLEIASCTDVGKIREINEDSLIAKELGNGIYLLAVADGMGGHRAGEVASKAAVAAVEETVRKLINHLNFKSVLVACASKANHEVYALSNTNENYKGMGTTLVAALVKEEKATIANVGDSRAYMIKGGVIRRVTKDHSYVQAMVDSGAISEEEASVHESKNIITRAVGHESEVKADFYEEDLAGGVLLLCSDGLTDLIKNHEIKEMVVNSRSLDEACKKLVGLANDRGGRDNITVILCRGKEKEVV